MIEINLIPDVKRELLQAQRMRATVIFVSIVTSIAAAGVVVALLLYIFGVQNVRGLVLDDQIEEKGKQLSQVEDLSKMLTIQNQLGKIASLNEQKVMASRTFDVLSAIIPPAPNGVGVSQLSIDTAEKTIRLEGVTRGYDSMEVFSKTLESAIFTYSAVGDDPSVEPTTSQIASEISITDTSFGENSDGQKVLLFTLSFVYADDLYSSKITDISYKLSANGNVTDSHLGIPKSIFTEKAKELTDEAE